MQSVSLGMAMPMAGRLFQLLFLRPATDHVCLSCDTARVTLIYGRLVRSRHGRARSPLPRKKLFHSLGKSISIVKFGKAFPRFKLESNESEFLLRQGRVIGELFFPSDLFEEIAKDRMG